jgi:hypothetical protein
MLHTYTEIKAKDHKEFITTIRNMIKWSMFGDEHYIHFYQPNGVNDEIDIDTFKSYTIGSKMCSLEFDETSYIEELAINPYKPLILVECNTDQKTYVIMPNKVKMTKVEMASLINEKDAKYICNTRLKSQILNTLVECSIVRLVGHL